MKGHTTLPYARQIAEMVDHTEKFLPGFENRDLSFWARTMHFEMRYLSIDQLLDDEPMHNIMEISSGYSFRGLDYTTRKDVHYIDTDLPDMIAVKKEMVDRLEQGRSERKGRLELLPLNALDEAAFKQAVSRFDDGPVAIVNEGLLLYLNTEEKEKLCRIIYDVLKERGGYWVTADIYLKVANRNVNMSLDDSIKRFFEEHNVEANRFESFEEAENLFQRMGFTIDKEAAIDYTRLSAYPYVIKNATAEDFERYKKTGKIHATWKLRVAGV